MRAQQTGSRQAPGGPSPGVQALQRFPFVSLPIVLVPVDDAAAITHYIGTMYTDNTLTPREVARLCALGILADGPASYADLAASARHFVSHIIGPSLDAMGQSIELLKYEGLVKTMDPHDAGDHEVLAISELGRQELAKLLLANIRHGATELNKLIIALKFRFLHTLGREQRGQQIDLLADMFENEQDRLESLRLHHKDDVGYLRVWLDREAAEASDRVAWLKALRLGEA